MKIPIAVIGSMCPVIFLANVQQSEVVLVLASTSEERGIARIMKCLESKMEMGIDTAE